MPPRRNYLAAAFWLCFAAVPLVRCAAARPNTYEAVVEFRDGSKREGSWNCSSEGDLIVCTSLKAFVRGACTGGGGAHETKL